MGMMGWTYLLYIFCVRLTAWLNEKLCLHISVPLYWRVSACWERPALTRSTEQTTIGQNDRCPIIGANYTRPSQTTLLPLSIYSVMEPHSSCLPLMFGRHGQLLEHNFDLPPKRMVLDHPLPIPGTSSACRVFPSCWPKHCFFPPLCLPWYCVSFLRHDKAGSHHLRRHPPAEHIIQHHSPPHQLYQAITSPKSCKTTTRTLTRFRRRMPTRPTTSP